MNLSDISPEILERNPELKELLASLKPASKYKNVETMAAGMKFQSGHEAVEIGKLILLEEHHQIFGLRLQVQFPVSKKITYIADAVYLRLEPSHDAGKQYLVPVVCDAKGFRNQTYKLKKKLFAEKYGMEIEEI